MNKYIFQIPHTEIFVEEGFNCRFDFGNIKETAETEFNSVGYIRESLKVSFLDEPKDNFKYKLEDGERRLRNVQYLQGLDTHNFKTNSDGVILVPIEVINFESDLDCYKFMTLTNYKKNYSVFEDAVRWKKIRDFYIVKFGEYTIGKVNTDAGVNNAMGSHFRKFWLMEEAQKDQNLPEHLVGLFDTILQELKEGQFKFNSLRKPVLSNWEKVDGLYNNYQTGLLDLLYDWYNTKNKVFTESENKSKKFTEKGFNTTLEKVKELGVAPEISTFMEQSMKYSKGELSDEEFTLAVAILKNNL